MADYSREWEPIGSSRYYDVPTFFRLKVHNGWIVSFFKNGGGTVDGVGAFFVPDEKHEWEFKK